MTFWIIAALVVVLFAAFAWWSSGRARPTGNRHDHQWSSTEADHVARSQGGGGFGGGMIGGGGS